MLRVNQLVGFGARQPAGGGLLGDWKVKVTIDNTQVSATLTDFPVYIALSDIVGTNFWSNVQTDGGDLRASTDADGLTQIPFEMVDIDTVAETGEVYAKRTVSSRACGHSAQRYDCCCNTPSRFVT